MYYDVTVPPTKEQGSYKTRVNDRYTSKSTDALSHYNSARARDGLKPVKRMPKGTTYRPLAACFGMKPTLDPSVSPIRKESQ